MYHLSISVGYRQNLSRTFISLDCHRRERVGSKKMYFFLSISAKAFLDNPYLNANKKTLASYSIMSTAAAKRKKKLPDQTGKFYMHYEFISLSRLIYLISYKSHLFSFPVLQADRQTKHEVSVLGVFSICSVKAKC